MMNRMNVHMNRALILLVVFISSGYMGINAQEKVRWLTHSEAIELNRVEAQKRFTKTPYLQFF